MKTKPEISITENHPTIPPPSLTELETRQILSSWSVPVLGTWEKYRITVGSTKPLLMNRVSEDAMKEMEEEVRTRKGRKIPVEAQAKFSRYLAKDYGGKGENLVIPRENIQAMVCLASDWFKIGKASLRPIILSVVQMEEPHIDLGTEEYSVDVRPIGLKSGGRVMKGRALINPWGGTFHVSVDADALGGLVTLKANGVKHKLPAIAALLEYGVSRIGLCDYRPQHKGTFGLGHITKVERIG